MPELDNFRDILNPDNVLGHEDFSSLGNHLAVINQYICVQGGTKTSPRNDRKCPHYPGLRLISIDPQRLVVERCKVNNVMRRRRPLRCSWPDMYTRQDMAKAFPSAATRLPRNSHTMQAKKRSVRGVCRTALTPGNLQNQVVARVTRMFAGSQANLDIDHDCGRQRVMSSPRKKRRLELPAPKAKANRGSKVKMGRGPVPDTLYAAANMGQGHRRPHGRSKVPGLRDDPVQDGARLAADMNVALPSDRKTFRRQDVPAPATGRAIDVDTLLTMDDISLLRLEEPAYTVRVVPVRGRRGRKGHKAGVESLVPISDEGETEDGEEAVEVYWDGAISDDGSWVEVEPWEEE